jgi:hypothetical protein
MPLAEGQLDLMELMKEHKEANLKGDFIKSLPDYLLATE